MVGIHPIQHVCAGSVAACAALPAVFSPYNSARLSVALVRPKVIGATIANNPAVLSTSFLLERAQMSPVHLRLLPRSSLEAPHGHNSC
jgi:patatin-like phospholipase/acyl hydrolase